MQKTLICLTTALLIQVSAHNVHAASEIHIDFFYDQLSDYGDWVEVGDYGYGWQPRDVDAEWRPYSDGRWAYTDAGWTWLSDEPYGWAVYHYGRWAQIETRGWVWIPGTEWAPAWVSWRRSPQHVGWAPLPPEASFRRNVGISGWADSYYDIGPSSYRFVEVRNFGAPRLRSVFVEPRENITIIQQTTNITRITSVDSVVHNGGPHFEDISRESAEPVRRLRLDRRVEIEGDRSSFRGEQMRSRVEGDSLRVFAPGIDARAAAPPQKLAEKIEKVQVNRGWKDAGPAADVEKLRAKVRGESKVPKELSPQPKFEKLAEQKTLPGTPPAKGKPVVVAPGENPSSANKKEGRNSNKVPRAPLPPLMDPTAAPSNNPANPDAPLKRRNPGKTPKPDDPEGRSKQPPVPPKPEKVVPPNTSSPNPERPGKNRQRQELPQPTPVDSVEPKGTPDWPDTRRELPPPQDQPARRKERAMPEGATPRRETPDSPKDESRKPKVERPETTQEVRPQPEHQKPQNIAPANVHQPARRGEVEKPKPGREKTKDNKKRDDEAPKAQ